MIFSCDALARAIKIDSNTIGQDLLVALFTGLMFFLMGIYWDAIRCIVKQEVRSLGKLLGKRAVEKGVVTVTLDTYADVRLLNPDLQRALGVSQPQVHPNRYYKIFPNQDLTWFPGASGPVMGYCSARGSGYLIDAFSPYLKKNGAQMKSDQEVSSAWEGSFINLGSSVSNIKTDDIKHHKATKWYAEDMHGIITLKDGQQFGVDDGNDRGMILKIQNPYFKGHSLIVCAGVGEWGTSGAAWYLARNWKSLVHRFGRKDFIVIVSVRPGSDESTQEIYSATDPNVFQRVLDWLKKKVTNRNDNIR